MSFGAPQALTNATVLPPERGAFPLDHDGECKQLVTEYLKCLKGNKGNNATCKDLSKRYLECRMQRGLMAKDNMENLGFTDKSR
ncbi:Cytochrome c oxidase assembly protein cox19 [Blastocladiella emersonii ATCC 22665]|nr:Cytochrome c oxidase assembly protein cox19 [Blastocladiella emersonii ATCC 22665]